MSQPVKPKHRVSESSENITESGGDGDISTRVEKAGNTSDSESPRRIRKRKPKHPSIEPPTPRRHHISPRRHHHPRDEPPVLPNLGNVALSPISEKKSFWKNKQVAFSFAMVIGLMLLLILIIAFVAAFAAESPFSQTTIITIKTIVRNRTDGADPSPFNETYWNTIRGDCGVSKQQPNLVSSRIVGGIEATPNSWPWLVSIVRYLDYSNGYSAMSHLCGGTLIGPSVVITAASCFAEEAIDVHEPDPVNLRVIVGGHVQLSLEDGAKLVEISKIVLHPRNNLKSFMSQQSFLNYDVAILKLAMSFEPKREIPATAFACLPRPLITPHIGKKCWVLGWGDSPNPGGLIVVNQIPQGILSQGTCQEHYSSYISYDKHLCVRERYIGACNSDRGGPLVCQGDDKKWTLYGAVSYSPGACITGPSIYTSIAMIVEWICCATKDVAICAASVPCKVN